MIPARLSNFGRCETVETPPLTENNIQQPLSAAGWKYSFSHCLYILSPIQRLDRLGIRILISLCTYLLPCGCNSHGGIGLQLAKPIEIPEESPKDVSTMTLAQIAIDEARNELEQDALYNIEYYYGYFGMNDDRRAVVAFRPVDLSNPELVEVVFSISVQRKTAKGHCENNAVGEDDTDAEAN